MKSTRRGPALTAALAALLLMAALALIAPHLRSGTELVRLRNALLMRDDLGTDADWRPPVPADFLQERLPAPSPFAEVAERLRLRELPGDWERAVAISTHLLGSQPVLHGGAIQSDLTTTYRRIVDRGDGYCGDFVRAFDALAAAAGLTVRNWAFSFDGFGGQGHVWVEVWNRQLGRWQLLDVFNNYYFTDGPSGPLSALEFRRALAAASPGLKLHPLAPQARAGYAVEPKAWEYFRRGLPEWYLWWGTNVYTYDAAPWVRRLGGLSRSLEQLGAIAEGVHPPLRVLPDEANRRQRESLRALQQRVRAAGVLAAAGTAVALVALLWAWRARRSGKAVR